MLFPLLCKAEASFVSTSQLSVYSANEKYRKVTQRKEENKEIEDDQKTTAITKRLTVNLVKTCGYDESALQWKTFVHPTGVFPCRSCFMFLLYVDLVVGFTAVTQS